MSKLTKKAIIYVEPDILVYLSFRAAEESRSISDIIHEVLSVLFLEDIENITDFDARMAD